MATPWHAILASAIFESKKCDNYLFLLEESKGRAKETTQLVLNSRGIESQNIGSLHKLEFREVLIRSRFLVKKELKKEKERLKRKIVPLIEKNKNINLYLFNPSSPVQRLVMEILGQAKITKVEDGLNDYIISGCQYIPWPKRMLKSLLIKLFQVKNIYGSNIPEKYGRISSLSLFPAKFRWKGPKHDLLQIVNKNLGKIMEGLKNSDSVLVNEKVGLVIGQSLYEDNTLSLDREISFYLKIANKMKEKCNHIIIKLHPRSSEEKIKRIKQEIKKEGNENISLVPPEKLPIEVAIYSGRYELIVGMWSNPVIYSKTLFGVHCYTGMYLLFEMYPELKNSHLFSIHKEIKQLFGEFYKDFREVIAK